MAATLSLKRTFISDKPKDQEELLEQALFSIHN